MPIRLNLLAEAHAAEEDRRRDPVKRAIWIAALFVVLILVWSSSLQLKAMLLQSDVSQLENQLKSRASEYQKVLDDQKRIGDIKGKLAALDRLSADRLLNGTLLNALQQTTVGDIQLLRLRVEQAYLASEGVKARTNEDKVVIPAKPPKSTEKVLLTLEGSDSSANPGDQVTKYKSALATNAYMGEMLVKTNGINLKSLGQAESSPLTGKRSVLFTLECRYPEKNR